MSQSNGESQPSPESTSQEAWDALLDQAEAMVPIIGRLYRRHGILTKVYGRLLTQAGPIDLLKIHGGARRVTGEGITVHDTFPILEGLEKLAPKGRLRIDVGRLAVRYAEVSSTASVQDFLSGELAALDETRRDQPEQPQDVVLYGFGRIGRLVARILMDKMGNGQGPRLRAIVVRPGADGDLEKRAGLLRRDSVHGLFDGIITADEENSQLIINGSAVKVIGARSPEDIDYTKYGIHNAVVIDNTGRWRDREGLSQHLKAKGAAKVILTAPGKGDIPNVVYGINHDALTGDEVIVSAASCTTNAIVPVLKVLDGRFGLDHGHIESCHSYTNDQNLIDNFHSKPRRGRGAPLNLVITETGAAKAVSKALPELEGKLTGNAIRVPTPNVSLAVLVLRLNKATTVDELNDILRRESLDGPYQLQIDYSSAQDAVSSDFVGNGHACVVDALATIVDGQNVSLYLWYDNEFGYSCQVVRLLERISGMRPPVFPAS